MQVILFGENGPDKDQVEQSSVHVGFLWGTTDEQIDRFNILILHLKLCKASKKRGSSCSAACHLIAQYHDCSKLYSFTREISFKIKKTVLQVHHRAWTLTIFTERAQHVRFHGKRLPARYSAYAGLISVGYYNQGSKIYRRQSPLYWISPKQESSEPIGMSLTKRTELTENL